MSGTVNCLATWHQMNWNVWTMNQQTAGLLVTDLLEILVLHPLFNADNDVNRSVHHLPSSKFLLLSLHATFIVPVKLGWERGRTIFNRRFILYTTGCSNECILIHLLMKVKRGQFSMPTNYWPTFLDAEKCPCQFPYIDMGICACYLYTHLFLLALLQHELSAMRFVKVKA